MIPRRRFAGALLSLPAFAIGEPTPRFRAVTLDGEKLDNDSVKGKVVLLQFWTTWCGYCRRDQEAVESIVKDYGGKGLVVLAVNVGESKKKVKQYLEDNPRTCKIALTENTNLAALFPTRGFPLYIALDKEGRIAGKQEGAGGESALTRLLEKAGLET